MRPSGLFGTEAAMRMIGLFYLNPEQGYRLSEVVDDVRDTVARRAAIDTLNRLVADGFVEKLEEPDTPRYRANPRCYIFDELTRIAAKTLGGFENVVAELERNGNVVAAAIYGSFAGRTQRADSDIDLLLIVRTPEDLSYFDLLGRIEAIAGSVGRQVNATSYTESEVSEARNEFLRDVLAGPLIWIKGGSDATGPNAR